MKKLLLLLPLLISISTISLAENPYTVTFVARECQSYTDVMANLARNNIMESLSDLGPDSAYSTEDLVSPSVEDSISTHLSHCIPLNDWQFTIGQNISGTKDAGLYGRLSKVQTQLQVTAKTRVGVAELNSAGNDTNRIINGAVTVELSSSQITIAKNRTLTVQGGKPGDPLLGSATLGFATLRCGDDNFNADNVEYARFPETSTRHIFCYAYYVNPAPYAGTIVIKKAVNGTPPLGSDPSFRFGGDVSYSANGLFTLFSAQSMTFFRTAAAGSGTNWTVFEDTSTLPTDYFFNSLQCVVEGSGGSSTNINGASVVINLRQQDKVTCTYNNRYAPIVADIQPLVECTAKNSATSYRAYFGYDNRDGVTTSVPLGINNGFSPTPTNRGQPTSFIAGRQVNVFSVPFDGAPLTWAVTGDTVVASSALSQRCLPTCIVPPTLTMNQCDSDLLIDGSRSGTLNNNGLLSSFSWTTTCDGELSNTTTLRPTLRLNQPLAGDTCSVTLRLVDTNGGVQSATCAAAISVPTCVTDCAGIPNGTTAVDECGVCNGNNSTCLDCAGIPNGKAQIDQCGICAGDNSTCADCADIPNGANILDSCGVCGGDGTSCVPNSCTLGTFDACGVCTGDNTTCLDCAGVPNGKTKIDNCGVCGGKNESCGGDECIDAPLVNDPETDRLIAQIQKDMNKLVRIALRYGSEAITCKKAKAARSQATVRAVNRIDTYQAATIENEISRDEQQICPNNICRKFSSLSSKKNLKEDARQLRKRIVNAKLAVRRCREPLRSNEEDSESSREIYNRIIEEIDSLADEFIVCNGLEPF